MSSSAWLYWAWASAFFAALTAIFAKIGLQGIDSDFATWIRTLVIVVALAAFLTYTGKWQNVRGFGGKNWLFLVLSGVALVVIGPEKLPKVARTVGALVGRAQRYVHDVKADIQREVNLGELKQLHSEVHDAAQSLRNTVQTQVDEARQAVGEVQSQLNEVSQTATHTLAEAQAQLDAINQTVVEPLAPTSSSASSAAAPSDTAPSAAHAALPAAEASPPSAVAAAEAAAPLSSSSKPT